MPRFTKVKDMRRARRMGQDQDIEALREDLKEVLDDPDSDYGDLHACLAEHFPEEAAQIHREVAQDARGTRDETREELDKRDREGKLSATDMAMDARARHDPNYRSFSRRFPGAARIE